MGDVFKEQIVKRAPNTSDTLKKVGLVAAAVVLFLVITVIVSNITAIGTFAPFLYVAIIFGLYYVMSFFNVEYEYILTNDELDIDIIYKRSRRKRVFSGSVKSFEVMAHVDDKVHAGDFNPSALTKDYSSGVTTGSTYAFLAAYQGKKLKVIIEPNDVLLAAMAKYLTPRKLFKRI
ncbi:MAG: DUF6106 family protein [Clostridiales bacterium]|jgi:hypothetical protein|nr:DUF6106 family protein [Clostridiales bacterium]